MKFLDDLNPKQREAVECLNGPLTVVAGPGSGKTRVLTYRIANLVRVGVPPYNILAVTFTNKAANEMKSRVIQLVGEKSSQVWMGTFHSILARILRRECQSIGFGSSFTIYDTADSLSLIKNVMAELRVPTQQFNPQAIRSAISMAKNQLRSPAEMLERSGDLFDEKCAVVYERYQQKLRQNNAMDFDDLLQKPIELFRSHARILDKYQDRLRFILVDEYQDTNRAQYMVMKLLAERHRNICVVGDDAQSIYSFRGADIRNMLDFERDYPERVLIRLEQNYRSTRTILRAADRLIKNNREQIPKDLWTENQEGEPVTILACDDDRDEGLAIVERIYAEVRQRGIALNQIALMYRTNAQSRALEDALRRNSIPYVIVGGIEFYQRKEIKDVLAYLRLLVNPKDDESFLRIVNYPLRGVGEAAVLRLKSFAAKHELSLLDASTHAAEIEGLGAKARHGITAVGDLLRKYQSMRSTMTTSELSRAMVDELGILPALKEEGTPEALGRWENIQELLSAITEFGEKHPGTTLDDFLQDVSLVAAVDEWDDTHNTVTLMTLHSAKGLEFPVVFITGLEEGLLPFYSSSPDRKELEEERRLCYVGVTRAMSKLYLAYARIRYRFGDLTYQTPSRFLDEVGEGLSERVERHFAMPRERHERKRVREHRNDEHYYRDEEPAYDGPSGGEEELRAGRLVEHELFGKGKVVTVSGKGEGAKAVVDFSSVGRKNLLLRYARLKLL